MQNIVLAIGCIQVCLGVLQINIDRKNSQPICGAGPSQHPQNDNSDKG
jgi:hypothetical protein